MSEQLVGASTLAPPVEAPSAEVLRSFVESEYGPVTEILALNGEVDRNYRVVADDGEWILKIQHPGAAATLQTVIDEELSGMAGIPVPRLVRTRGGASTVTANLTGEDVVCRMTSFLPGVSPRKAELTASFFTDLGRTLANLHSGLARVDPALTNPRHPWHIQNAGSVLNRLELMDLFPEKKAWMDALRGFKNSVLPLFQQLPSQVIHNDLNPDNILVNDSGTAVTGIFDFGDAVFAPRVVDVANGAAYFVPPMRGAAMIDAVVRIVSGYRTVTSLSGDEVRVIPQIMSARWAMALTINRLRAIEHSDDAAYVEYVTRNSERSAQRLAAWTNIDPDLTEAALKNA